MCYTKQAKKNRKRCEDCLSLLNRAQRKYQEDSDRLRQCRQCHDVKETKHFMSRRRTYGGVTDWCKSCCEQNKESGLSYCGRCDRWLPVERFWNTSFSSSRKKSSCRSCLVGASYGISGIEFDHLLESQGSACAMCGAMEGRGERSLHVDHDHITGQVRGFLCDDCNRGIGMLRDSTVILSKAIEYLVNPPAMIHLGKRLAPIKDEPSYWEADACQT